MSTIFYLSSLESTGIGGSFTVQFLIHKSLHLFVYSLLSSSLYFGLIKSGIIKNKYFLTSLLLTYLYGVSDEVHQYFVPGRGAKFTDTLFDLLGAYIGAKIFQKISQK